MSTWIYIERERSNDLMVGPYSSEHPATHAMENAALIDYLCARDCTDCYVTMDQPTTQDVLTIDPDDPTHTGVDLDKSDAVIIFLQFKIKEYVPNGKSSAL